jgi:hypothetical protein
MSLVDGGQSKGHAGALSSGNLPRVQAIPNDLSARVTRSLALSLRLVPPATIVMGVGALARSMAANYMLVSSMSFGLPLADRLPGLTLSAIVGLVPATAMAVLAFAMVRRRSRTPYAWLIAITAGYALLTANGGAANLSQPTADLGGRGAGETELVGSLTAGGSALFLIGILATAALLALPSTRRSLA